MGLKYQDIYAIDCMLETVFLVYYLLIIILNLSYELDGSGSFNLLIISENNNNTISNNKGINIQSAENFLDFSETIRQLPANLTNYNKLDDFKFYSWLAGVIDGDGNFDIRKMESDSKKVALRAIRIKLHIRDVRILTRIQDKLHMGRIKTYKNSPYALYIVSTRSEMEFLMSKLNGLIRIKVDSFKKACLLYNIEFITPDYIIKKNDPYFSGLIDTDGSIVFNFNSNRIECNLEFKYNQYTSKLNLDYFLQGYKPYVLIRNNKKNHSKKTFKSIAFKYQTVKGMVPLYDYFMLNRLYSDFKFFRVSQIKKFVQIRHFQNSDFNSVEFQIYSDFLLNWIQYNNPLWTKVPFVNKLKSR
jgi:LAGLIDADG endonuclease